VPRTEKPPHYGNDAVEASVRQVRLRLLRADSVRTYAEDTRAHLVLASGQQVLPAV